MPTNYWDEFEYSKLKLLCHKEKVQSIIEVGDGVRLYDNLPPISVELHLTNVCNLNCPWCTDRNLRNHIAIPTEKCKELIRYFGQCRTGVTFEGGGEPTLHPAFGEIVDCGCANNVDMGLITNGTRDISEWINKFKWVRISLDASNGKEYRVEKGCDMFEQVLGNIARYKTIRDSSRCYLGVGYVLTTRNVNDIDRVVDVLDEACVDYIYFRPVEEAPEITPSIDALYDLRKRLIKIMEKKRIKFSMLINDRLEHNNADLPCIAHGLTTTIHADGTVVCCEKRRHDPVVYGNINKLTFDDIWNSSIRIETSKKLCEAKNQVGCSVCRITSFNKIFANLKTVNTRKFI